DGESVRSCLMLAAQAKGRTVETVESLADPDGELHTIQKPCWDQHGRQCGFCTPGFLIGTKELLDANPQPSEDEIREALGGNLCRCSCYHTIVHAVQDGARRV